MEDRIKRQLRDVETWPRRSGRKEYVKHLRGGRLTRDEAIRAMCYSCVAGEDTDPCKVLVCPLTQYCPRNRKGGIADDENLKSCDS